MTVLLLALSLGAYAAIDGFNADGLPYAREGLGVRRNFYQSGRISAKVADIAGIFELNYVGKQPFKNQRFYSSNEQCTFCRCLVPQVLIDDTPYRLTFANTVHYPFGYSSECTIDGVKLRHELVLDCNAAFRRVTVMENPQGKRVRCRIVQMNAGMGQGAKWKIWGTGNGERGTGCLVAEATFEGGAKVTMEIGAANSVAFPLNRDVNPRAYPQSPDARQDFRFDMEETEAGDNHLFWWVFDKVDGEELDDARVDRVYTDFKARHAADVRFETGDAFVDGWLGYVAPMSAAHEVDGIGAFRASPTYWVWGWDALVHSGALAICGRAAEVKRMLAFFRDNAAEDGRIHHAYSTDLAFRRENLSAPDEVCFDAVNSSFWLILLNEYVNATGDEAFKAECLPFARRLVEKNRATLRDDELLPRGQGLFPDNRYPLEQEKDDFVLFNCSVYWQGLCAWRELSGEGTVDCEAAAKDIVAKFWDAESGYWGDSWSAVDSRRRDWRPLHGLYHVSSAARSIMPGDAGKICDFMEREFLFGDRLAMFARTSSIRCADGNQYGAYYPVVDRTFWNMQNRAGRVGAIDLFRRIVAAHARVLTYPEGQTVDVANPDPADYSDELGNKQFFSEKVWLADALDLWLGLGVEKDGLRFRPMNDGKPFVVRGLQLRGKTLDIAMTGSGSNATMEFNGKKITGAFIPWSDFKPGRNALRIVVSGECAEAGVKGQADRKTVPLADKKPSTVVARLKSFPYPAGKEVGRLAVRNDSKRRGEGCFWWSVGCECMDRDYANWDSYKDYLPVLGVSHARFISGWAKTEKIKGVYDFAWLDQHLRECSASGVKPWVTLAYGNPLWGSDFNLGMRVKEIVDNGETFDAWIRYVKAVVGRYADIVDEWEVWNEPFRQEEYAEFFYRTAKAIFEVQPSAKIYCACCNNIDAYRRVLDKMKAEGSLDLCSNFIYHPYDPNPDASYAKYYEPLSRLLAEYSPRLKAMQGESGCPAQLEFDHALNNVGWTELSKAKWDLRRAIGDAVRRIPSHAFAMIDFQYTFMLQSFGMLRANALKEVVYRRPSWYAMQNVYALFDEAVVPESVKTVETSVGELTVAAFRRNGKPIFFFWLSGRIPSDKVEFARLDLSRYLEGIDNPQWIEFATGRVFSLASTKDVPVWDSPVLVCGRGAVDVDDVCEMPFKVDGRAFCRVAEERSEVDLCSLYPEDFLGDGSTRKAEITFAVNAPEAGEYEFGHIHDYFGELFVNGRFIRETQGPAKWGKILIPLDKGRNEIRFLSRSGALGWTVGFEIPQGLTSLEAE